MDGKQQRFLRAVDRFYAVASRVGNRDVCLQAGSLAVVVKHSVPELRSAWEQFVHTICKDRDQAALHLQYFASVIRNWRGSDAVSLLELSADVAFAVQIDASVQITASSVDLVA